MTEATPDGGPLVSVLVPTFNGRRYIASAIASLQTQDHERLEIVIVDDGSTDDTGTIVAGLASADERIVLIRGPRRGIAASRNAGLARSCGALVTFLDHDDLCPPGKVARQVALLAEKPGAIAVFGRTVTFASTETDAAKVDATKAAALTMSLSAALFRRRAFERVGVFDGRFALADDFDFILRLCEAGLEIAVEDAVATLHRRHAAQATADLGATRREVTLALAESLKRRRAAGMVGDLHNPLLAAAPR